MNLTDIHGSDEKEQEEYKKTLEQASLYFEKKEWDIAEELYKEALEIKPDDKLCLEQLKKIIEGRSLLQKNQEEFEKTIEQASTYFEKKEWDIAEELYKEALEIKPGDKLCLDQLAMIKDGYKLTEKDQDEYEITIEQASAYFEKKEWDIAEELYKEALEIKPDDKLCLEQLGRINERRNQFQKDNEEYERIVKQASENYANEDWDHAKDQYLAALNIHPQEELILRKIIDECDIKISDNKVKLIHLWEGVENLFKDGNKREALQLLINAQILNPKNEDISSKIEKLSLEISNEEFVDSVQNDSKAEPIEPDEELSNIEAGSQGVDYKYEQVNNLNKPDKDITKNIKANPRSKKLLIISGGVSIFIFLIFVGYVIFRKDAPPTPEVKHSLALKPDESLKSVDSSKKVYPIANVQEVQKTEQKAESIIKIKSPKTKDSLAFENGNYYLGNVKAGKMHGKGTYYFITGGLISKNDPFERFAATGDSIVGTWYDGELDRGNHYGNNGVLKERIILGRN